RERRSGKKESRAPSRRGTARSGSSCPEKDHARGARAFIPALGDLAVDLPPLKVGPSERRRSRGPRSRPSHRAKGGAAPPKGNVLRTACVTGGASLRRRQGTRRDSSENQDRRSTKKREASVRPCLWRLVVLCRLR